MAYDPKRFNFTLPIRVTLRPRTKPASVAPAPAAVPGTGSGYVRPYLKWFNQKGGV